MLLGRPCSGCSGSRHGGVYDPDFRSSRHHGGVDDPDPVASQLRGVFEQGVADSAVRTGRSCCPVGWARGLLWRPCHSSSHGSFGSFFPDDPHDPFGLKQLFVWLIQLVADPVLSQNGYGKEPLHPQKCPNPLHPKKFSIQL